MKIACQSCQAKYTIADEKVLGRIVKIRCKKCGSTVVVNGNDMAQQASGDAPVEDYTGQQSSEQWTVNVADDDQRTMTVAEIAAEYRAGVVTDETFVWQDGMPDWLTLREVPRLHSACQLGPRPTLNPDLPEMALAAYGSTPRDVDPTDQMPALNGNGNGTSEPIAARRTGARGAGADLFGGGREDDVMTSAGASPGAQSSAPDSSGGKLTGQRNENSVLFSLSALTQGGTPPPPTESATSATSDGSGLIDIRALSAGVGSSNKKESARPNPVDDIMNLGGGGAFGAALAAPILAPPPVDASMMGGAPASSNNLKYIIIGLGVALLLVVGGFGYVLMSMKSAPPPTASTPPVEAPAGTSAPTAPTAAATNPEPVAAAPGDTHAAPPSTGEAVAKNAPTKPAPGAKPGAAPAPAPEKPVAAAAPAPAAGGPKSLSDALREASGAPKSAPAAAPQENAPPFNRGAAQAAMAGVNIAGCKRADGPTGQGRVVITFSPSGSVKSAVVESPPFAGTAVGGCIAGKYRGVRVPAFSGGELSVGKSFMLE